MAGFVLKGGIALVAVLGVLFQVYLSDIFWKVLALDREIQPITDFPYTCRRIVNPRLQACEDMWLSEATRQLFLACSDPAGRAHWTPLLQELKWDGRSRIDAVIAMDIDRPDGDSFAYRQLSISGLPESLEGDEGRMYLNGISGAESGNGDESKITLALVNFRPSVDPATGRLLDQTKVGANASVEIFETGPHAKELKHVRTFTGPGITTPNRPALAGNDVDAGFYVTNESKEKVGLKAKLASFLPLGSVSFCDGSGCHEVDSGFKFPNGLLRTRDGLLYLPTSGTGEIFLYREVSATPTDGSPSSSQAKKVLERVGYVDVGAPLDNISEDADGDLFVPGFPKPLEVFQSARDPLARWPRSSIFRIRKSGGADGGNYTLSAEKILEDRDRVALPGTTTVIHDAKTGRLFLSGITSPFITVCDPK